MRHYTSEQSTLVIEACARAAHEANRAFCMASGDQSQVSWEDAQGWQKDSARKGVAKALELLAESASLPNVFDQVDQLDVIPEKLHESWMADKLKDGWSYGPIKDSTVKKHPALLPYAELPKAQRVKDELFLSVVVAMKHVLDEVMS